MVLVPSPIALERYSDTHAHIHVHLVLTENLSVTIINAPGTRSRLFVDGHAVTRAFLFSGFKRTFKHEDKRKPLPCFTFYIQRIPVRMVVLKFAETVFCIFNKFHSQ